MKTDLPSRGQIWSHVSRNQGQQGVVGALASRTDYKKCKWNEKAWKKLFFIGTLLIFRKPKKSGFFMWFSQHFRMKRKCLEKCQCKVFKFYFVTEVLSFVKPTPFSYSFGVNEIGIVTNPSLGPLIPINTDTYGGLNIKIIQHI
jgi:hypothetical protein